MSDALSTEALALHAVIEDDLDEARRIIATILPSERRALARQAHQLADLCGEVDRLQEIATGACRWARRCPSDAAGYTIHQPPSER